MPIYIVKKKAKSITSFATFFVFLVIEPTIFRIAVALVSIQYEAEVIDILKSNASAKGQWQSFVRT